MPVVDLATVGEAFEDFIFVGLPRLPRPGEEIKTDAFVQTLGGGAVITAIAAARIGATCQVISGLSPAAADLLGREGIAMIDLRRPREPHAVSAALSTPRNRAFVTFNGINNQLESRLLRALSRVRARHVHLALYPRQCSRWRRLAAGLRRSGVTTSADFGWNEDLANDPAFLPLVAELDYFFVNEQEAVFYSRARGLGRAARFWRARTRTTVIKLGPRGSRWVAPDLDVTAPAPRVRVVDTTGAGDAYNGGFLAARLAGGTPRACLTAGNRIGAQSTRAAGGINALPRKRRVA